MNKDFLADSIENTFDTNNPAGAVVEGANFVMDTASVNEEIRKNTPKDGYDKTTVLIEEDENMSTEKKAEELGKAGDKYQDHLDRSAKREERVTKSRLDTFMSVAGTVVMGALAIGSSVIMAKNNSKLTDALTQRSNNRLGNLVGEGMRNIINRSKK